MSWAHLPVAGGIYDQHPKFIDDMATLMQIENEIEAKRHKEQERKNKMKKGRR